MDGQSRLKNCARQDKEAVASRVRQLLVCTSKSMEPLTDQVASNISNSLKMFDHLAPFAEVLVCSFNSERAFA